MGSLCAIFAIYSKSIIISLLKFFKEKDEGELKTFSIFREMQARRFSHQLTSNTRTSKWGFPGGTVVKNPPANAGDPGSIPGLGRSHMPWSN